MTGKREDKDQIDFPRVVRHALRRGPTKDDNVQGVHRWNHKALGSGWKYSQWYEPTRGATGGPGDQDTRIRLCLAARLLEEREE